MKPRVLIIAHRYLPGFMGGGPIRSVSHLVDWLGDEFEFSIITSDRDAGQTAPYPSVVPGRWMPVGKARVLYLDPNRHTLAGWRRLLTSTDYELLYVNSFFNPQSLRILLLYKAGMLAQRQFLLAPRGEFSQGAIALKATKKRLCVRLVRLLRMHDGIVWQASSIYEQEDIERTIGRGTTGIVVRVAPNLPSRSSRSAAPATEPPKCPGSARIILLSRITPSKNVLHAIELLDGLPGSIQFDIAGPIIEPGYWDQCMARISTLSNNIRVRHLGAVPPEEVPGLMARYHLFLLPTLGENFGHVILEALSAGCPVLISDQTPWRGLADDRAGWDLPLADHEGFRRALCAVVEMDDAALNEWRTGARARALAFFGRDDIIHASRELLSELSRTR